MDIASLVVGIIGILFSILVSIGIAFYVQKLNEKKQREDKLKRIQALRNREIEKIERNLNTVLNAISWNESDLMDCVYNIFSSSFDDGIINITKYRENVHKALYLYGKIENSDSELNKKIDDTKLIDNLKIYTLNDKSKYNIKNSPIMEEKFRNLIIYMRKEIDLITNLEIDTSYDLFSNDEIKAIKDFENFDTDLIGLPNDNNELVVEFIGCIEKLQKSFGFKNCFDNKKMFRNFANSFIETFSQSNLQNMREKVKIKNDEKMKVDDWLSKQCL